VSYFTETCLKFKNEKEVELVTSSRHMDSMNLSQVVRTLPACQAIIIVSKGAKIGREANKLTP